MFYLHVLGGRRGDRSRVQIPPARFLKFIQKRDFV